MTKVPGTDRGFPGDDYYSFYNLGNTTIANVHNSNVMRLNNTGSNDLIVSDINITGDDDFVFQLFENDGSESNLPVSVEPGSFVDVEITFVGETGNFAGDEIGFNGLFEEMIEIISNADNAEDNSATLHGGYAPRPENTTELDVQQTFELFGFQSSSLSLVNENGTIQPLNPNPTFPDAVIPSEEEVNNGYEGDLILSSNFVQADPSKPVIGFQLAAFHGGPDSDGASFRRTNSNVVVGGINFSHERTWYSTIFPRQNDGQINFDSRDEISEAFRIRAVNWTTSGFVNGLGNTIVGVKVYKVIDHNGNLIPNEYMVTQDFVGAGVCVAGSGDCDYNDNIFYFINIKPEVDPSVEEVIEESILIDELITFNFNDFFDLGYPGNELKYTIDQDDIAGLPSWLAVSINNGIIAGIAPEDAVGQSISIDVSATDLNGIVVNTTFIINVDGDIEESSLSSKSIITGNESSSIIVDDLKEANSDLVLTIYPNPSSEIVNLIPNNNSILSVINIYDTTGKKVLTFDGESTKNFNEYVLDVSLLQNGIYIVHAIDENDKAENTMLVIQN